MIDLPIFTETILPPILFLPSRSKISVMPFFNKCVAADSPAAPPPIMITLTLFSMDNFLLQQKSLAFE